MKMSRANRFTIEDLDRIIRLAGELRRSFPAAVAMSEDVSLG